jgi:hypothetical protein
MSASANKPPKEKQAERLIALVSSRATLFHDPDGEPYAAVPTDTTIAVHPLRSSLMQSWIRFIAHKDYGFSPSSNAMTEALMTLAGVARFEKEERQVYLRVAQPDEETIYIDLGDDTGACIEVTGGTWTILDAAPVMFRRPKAMRALPRPVRGGTIDDLRPFLNLPDEDGFVLFIATQIAAFRPGRPFVIFCVQGPQGTAKTTMTRFWRGLVDPNKAPTRTPPRKEDDLLVATKHSHVVAFENVSGIPPWMSDALCRLATGGGLSKRTLYTDDDETVMDAIRPVIVNGIDDIANRGDLAERCVVVTLTKVKKRRAEDVFLRAFEQARPRILGALLDGVASALVNLPVVAISDLPRMADFAKWITAAEPGLGLAPGTCSTPIAGTRTPLSISSSVLHLSQPPFSGCSTCNSTQARG